MGLSLLLSLEAYARAVGGVLVVSPLPGVWAWFYLVVFLVSLYVGSGVRIGYPMPGMWALIYLVGLPVCFW